MEKLYGLEIKWLSVTCFELKFGGITVVTDPYITECVGTDMTWEAIEKCDIICLTHAHWDHITDIPRLVEKFHPLIMCGEQTAMPLARWLDYTPSRIYPMYPNQELDFDDVKIKALYGRHTDLKKGFKDPKNFQRKYPPRVQFVRTSLGGKLIKLFVESFEDS